MPGSEFLGISLNKALLTGLDLLSNLTGIVAWFRYTATISWKFHSMMLILSNFFWQDNISDDNLEIYQMVVHIFGGKDSPCSGLELRKNIVLWKN